MTYVHVLAKLIRPVLAAVLYLSCTANKRPSKAETALANMAKDVVIPLEAKKLSNPLPTSQEVLQQAQRIYTQSCALCHGADARGSTDLGRAMYPPAMDLTSPHVQHWSDAELFWITQNGVRMTGMPAWKSLISGTDTWKLVRFIHALPQAQATGETSIGGVVRTGKSQSDLINYGRTLYRQEGCYTCHQLNGEGAKVGPDLTVEGSRGRTDEWLIGHFKDPSAYSPGSMMFSYKNLTDEQLRALTVFLQNQKGALKK